MKLFRFLLIAALLSLILFLPAAACDIHITAYHALPKSLIEYVGHDMYSVWSESRYGYDTDGCTQENIYNFIHDLDIPYEVFADICRDPLYSDGSLYHLPVLYSADAVAAEQYYRKENRAENELPPTADTGLMPLAILFAASFSFMLLYHKKNSI